MSTSSAGVDHVLGLIAFIKSTDGIIDQAVLVARALEQLSRLLVHESPIAKDDLVIGRHLEPSSMDRVEAVRHHNVRGHLRQSRVRK